MILKYGVFLQCACVLITMAGPRDLYRVFRLALFLTSSLFLFWCKEFWIITLIILLIVYILGKSKHFIGCNDQCNVTVPMRRSCRCKKKEVSFGELWNQCIYLIFRLWIVCYVMISWYFTYYGKLMNLAIDWCTIYYDGSCCKRSEANAPKGSWRSAEKILL